jgi:2'-5' RNA ligase
MAGQPSLFGDQSVVVQKYFYAFKPAAADASRLAALQAQQMREHALTGKPIREDLLHLTICHLQEFDGVNPEFERKARRAGDAVRHGPVTITLDRVASFEGNPSNRPFVLRGGDGVKGVEAFQQHLYVAMAATGLGKYAKNYTPHTTFTYDRKLIAEQLIEPFTWRATELLLIRSPQGLTQHDHIASWTLGG